MHKPRYCLLQEVYYIRDGNLHDLKIHNIIYAKDGIFPFEHLKDVIYYTDDEDDFLPESLLFPTARQAIQAEIQRLSYTLDSIPNDK